MSLDLDALDGVCVAPWRLPVAAARADLDAPAEAGRPADVVARADVAVAGREDAAVTVTARADVVDAPPNPGARTGDTDARGGGGRASWFAAGAVLVGVAVLGGLAWWALAPTTSVGPAGARIASPAVATVSERAPTSSRVEPVAAPIARSDAVAAEPVGAGPSEPAPAVTAAPPAAATAGADQPRVVAAQAASAPWIVSFAWGDTDAGALAPPASLRGCRALRVVGHTCDLGAPDANRRIGLARATAVRDALVAAGFPPDTITLESAGEDSPVASNATPDGRARNRRVETVCIQELP